MGFKVGVVHKVVYRAVCSEEGCEWTGGPWEPYDAAVERRVAHEGYHRRVTRRQEQEASG